MKYSELHHKDQPATRLREVGSASLTNAELLSVAMYFNDCETTQAISSLFVEYGSLRRIPRNRLTEIKGVGEKVADAICAVAELTRREAMLTTPELPVINSPADAAALVQYEMGCLEVEQMRLLLLDQRNRVRKVVTLYSGTLNSSNVRVSEVFRDAVRENSASIVVFHNHPSGDPSPSPEDVAVTRAIVSAGKNLDISVLDHIVIGQGRWCSLKERGLGFS